MAHFITKAIAITIKKKLVLKRLFPESHEMMVISFTQLLDTKDAATKQFGFCH